MTNLKLSDFDFEYPRKLVAMYPLKKRDAAKMMLVNREKQTITHSHISCLPELYSKDDLIVRNNTKVFPARLIGKKKETGGRVEIFLIRQKKSPHQDTCFWHCMINMSKKIKSETKITLSDNLEAIIKEPHVDFVGTTPLHLVEFSIPNALLMNELASIGQTPLPPYIKRDEESSDKETYQTLYATQTGAVAAPTAGLHFTNELIQQIEQRGTPFIDVTLHVGPGTFVPVETPNIIEHSIHSEEFFITEPNYNKILTHLTRNNPVTAIGTTSVRTLETAFPDKKLHGESSLFIYPGYKFQVVKKLLTNFHLPKSTLFMLTSAFIGDIAFAKECYKEAFKKEYRLFSYGDAMLII